MKTIQAMSLDLLEGNFISLDFETTGLNPRSDAIIEAGMVRMVRGEISETYSQLINPNLPIPGIVTQLTGITDADCAGQPDIEAAFQEISSFIGSQWLIAHNASFDFDFLEQARRKTFMESPGFSFERVVDTLMLARLLLPWLPNHRLETLVEFLEIPTRPVHRALADAEATALVFLDLINRARSLTLSQIDTIEMILHGARDGLRLFFKQVRLWQQTNGPAESVPVDMPGNILGKISITDSPQKPVPLSKEDVESFFGESGPLSRHLDNYEIRKPQSRMAAAVCQALNRNEFLLTEAGTGVGKSMAYLIPVVLWGMQNPGHRIIVTTYTKTLQDQLFQKELPLLITIYPDGFSAVLLKGRSNYLCIRRYRQLCLDMHDRLSAKERFQLLPLVYWADITHTGDIEENPGFLKDFNHGLWAQIHSDSQCPGSNCPFYHECFLQQIRRASRAANITVINHALLFSGITQAHSILGEFHSLIVDEAHQIERTASQYLGVTLSMGLFWETVQWLYQAHPEEVGVLMMIRSIIESGHWAGHGEKRILQQIGILEEMVAALLQEARHCFQRLGAFAEERLLANPSQMRIRLRHVNELHQALGIVYGQVLNAVQKFAEELNELVKLLGPLDLSDAPELENLEHELSAGFDRLNQLQEVLNHFQSVDYADHVIWCEKRIYQENPDVILQSVPLDIAKILGNVLLPALDRCVMTSATMTVGDDFDYIKNRLGFQFAVPDRVQTRIFGSPFHYPDQALFLVSTFLPYPKAESYHHKVARFIARVIQAHHRGTLVLFTSHRMLQDVYAVIGPVLESCGIQVLAQGISGSRSAILKSFIENEQSVLLGTSSFWEGVDVPGKALEMLIITRVPFDVPTEPLIEARMEEAEKRHGSGFFNFAVPEAVIRFRQGFGRLIRSSRDRGIVILLDQRVVKSRYGQLFLSSLPVDPQICETEGTMMDKIEKWF
ncbi:hypothetical protein JW948_19110 [bacterium]|nr:hypothetical protein [bacterium]